MAQSQTPPHAKTPISANEAVVKPPDPGIIFVGSSISRPEHLSPSAFVAWYEDTHVEQVIATGGVARAARYERLFRSELTGASTANGSIQGKTDGGISSKPEYSSRNHREHSPPTGVHPASAIPPTPRGPPPRWLTNDDRTTAPSAVAAPAPAGEKEDPYPWLTVYAMPSLAFRHSPRFRALDGQSAPSAELLARVFANARFATRFAALRFERAADNGGGGGGNDQGPLAAAVVVAATVGGVRCGEEEGFGRRVWDRVGGGRAGERRGEEGVRVGMQLFRIADSTVLDGFVRRQGRDGCIVLVQYFGDAWQRKGKGMDHGEEGIVDAIRSGLVEMGGKDVDIGAFKLRRTYASGVES